jgi:nuclear protein localization protein 4 homolog
MLLRVRFPDGSTARIDADGEPGLRAAVAALQRVAEPYSLHADVRCTAPFDAVAAAPGDLVYVRGERVVDLEEEAREEEQRERRRLATERVEAAARALGEADRKAAERVEKERKRREAWKKGGGGEAVAKIGGERDEEPPEWRPRCLHGPKGMCEGCAPAEDRRGRYLREVAKWKGKGMSVAVMEALDALKYKVKPQDEPWVAAAVVDAAAAEEFQSYLAKLGFAQQRIGICYGRYAAEEKETRVEAVYEPVQRGSADTYELVAGDDAGDIGDRASRLAGLLDMRCVGMVVSARARKCILSAKDVVTACSMLAELSEAARKDFVVLLVGVEETGKTSFEAYQISDQAVEMYEAGIFAPLAQQKPNGGRVLTTEDVLVEDKETRKVHTEFFLANIPIKSAEEGKLRVKFPVENRDLQPQGPGDVRAAVAAAGDLPYGRRIADFHLLLFLSAFFDMGTDMPGLAATVKDGKDEVAEGYRLMIDSMAAG